MFFAKNSFLSFLLHYIVWELLYMLIGLPGMVAQPIPDWGNFFFNYGMLGSVNFLLFYSMAFYVIPRFFVEQRKMAILIGLFLTAALFFTYIKYKIEVWNAERQLEKLKALMLAGKPLTAMPVGPQAFSSYMRNFVWFNFIIIIIAFAYRLLLIWYKQEKIRKDLENQMLRAELSFLKMQVNPHFLFNSLNNIYSLAILEKSYKTGDSIMKLSDMIRYILYEKEDEQNRVSLDKEIKHINSFIDLQQLRLEGKLHIRFSIEGDINGKKITPLLLLPLVENSFKHGELQDPERPVDIELKIHDKAIQFAIRNAKNNYLKDQTGGIGLENVRKRLSLLYPGNHTLDIKDNETDFFVELHLPL